MAVINSEWIDKSKKVKIDVYQKKVKGQRFQIKSNRYQVKVLDTR